MSEEIKNDPTALRKMAVMQAQGLQFSSRAYLANLLNDLAFKPGLDGNQKVSLINSVLDAVQYALNFGIDVTKIQLPSGRYSRMATELAAVLAQAMDNRMLILAQKLEDKEKEEMVNNPHTGSTMDQFLEEENIKLETQEVSNETDRI